MVKIEDEHMSGTNFFVSAKFNFVDSGFYMKSMSNETGDLIGLYNITDARWDTYSSVSGSARGRWDWDLNATYFNDNLLGMGHEVKFGFYYSNRRTWGKSESFPQLRYKWNSPQFDITGDKRADIVPDLYQLRTTRWSNSSAAQDAMSAYVQDTLSAGRFNIIFGLRWDRQSPFIEAYDVPYNVDETKKVWADQFDG